VLHATADAGNVMRRELGPAAAADRRSPTGATAGAGRDGGKWIRVELWLFAAVRALLLLLLLGAAIVAEPFGNFPGDGIE